MKKRILATLFVFAVLTSILVACGKKAEESVKEEPETPVVEEAKTELEQVVEEKESEEKEVEEPDEWRETYLEELENLGDEWKGEDSSYGMIYVNDDDIPEIITRRSGTQSDALYISTYNSNEKKVETVGYLSSGLVISYKERENIIGIQVDRSWDYTDASIDDDMFFRIEDNKWEETEKEDTIKGFCFWEHGFSYEDMIELIRQEKTNTSYPEVYMNLINSIKPGTNGYILEDIDDNGIPEMIVGKKADEISYDGTVDIYTVFNGHCNLIEHHNDASYESATARTVDCYVGKNVIASGYKMAIGANVYYERINNGQTEIIYNYNSTSDAEGNDMSSLNYKRFTDWEKAGNLETEIVEGLGKPVSFSAECIDPEGEKQPYKSLNEIMDELQQEKFEITGEEAGSAEPWKLTYRNLLYDFMSGKNIYEQSYNETSRFMIKDMDNDNSPELLICGYYDDYHKDWYAFDQTSDSLDNYVYSFYGIVPETGELLSLDTDIYNVALRGCIETIDGKITVLYDDDYEDWVWDESTGKEIETYPHHYTIEEKTRGKNDSTERVATAEEVQSIKDKIEKYSGNFVGGILITPENIEKTLGLSSESTESKKQTKESDNSLYTVEVTAPDGYVNFRTGAGTDYEIISPISNGEQLSVITDEGKWLQVEYQGKTGWVASSQVTKTP